MSDTGRPSNRMPYYVLQHTRDRDYYAGMALGSDVRTDRLSTARGWKTRAAAERFGQRFGARYAVVSSQ